MFSLRWVSSTDVGDFDSMVVVASKVRRTLEGCNLEEVLVARQRPECVRAPGLIGSHEGREGRRHQSVP